MVLHTSNKLLAFQADLTALCYLCRKAYQGIVDSGLNFVDTAGELRRSLDNNVMFKCACAI